MYLRKVARTDAKPAPRSTRAADHDRASFHAASAVSSLTALRPGGCGEIRIAVTHESGSEPISGFTAAKRPLSFAHI